MSDSALTSPDLVIVLAQALTGLGHLRLTHAIYRGLPPGAHAIMLTSQDENINYLHKILSTNPILQNAMEFVQSGWAEDAVTIVTRWYFRRKTEILEKQLQTILDQNVTKPKTLLVVCTHLNIGHQLAEMKKEFERKNNVHVVLIVVVSDDSPQNLWAVGGADMVFVPSEYCKRQLQLYQKSQPDLPPTRYIFSPYELSPDMTIELTDAQFRRRIHELDPAKLAGIHFCIPISGAAVQLSYFEKLIHELDRLTDRMTYHIIAQQSDTTRDFLGRMIGKGHIKLHVSSSHREVVELYEKAYEEEVMALEVTKPSEHAFKGLAKPRLRGGVIMLFSDPVGRQEWDNMKFLQRHGLLPNIEDQRVLWRDAQLNREPSETIMIRARSWRALRLPTHAVASARFIWWALEHRLFATMMRFSGYQDNPELTSQGVAMFWRNIENYLKANYSS